MFQNTVRPRGRPRSFDERQALEKAIQVFWSKGYDEIVDRHPVVTLRPEDLGRLFQRLPLIEAARSTARPDGIVKHSVQNSLTISIVPINIELNSSKKQGGLYFAGPLRASPFTMETL